MLSPPRPNLELGTTIAAVGPANTLRQTLLAAGRFYQFRLAMDNSLQAKGAFKVMDDVTAAHVGADIVLPSSAIKPFPRRMVVPSGGIRLCSRVALGVREISRPLEFASSYTLIEHAPKEALLEEIFPQAVREIRALKQAWNEGRHDALVERIGARGSIRMTSKWKTSSEPLRPCCLPTARERFRAILTSTTSSTRCWRSGRSRP